METGDFKINLSGLLHRSNIDNLGDVEMVMERGANTMLTKISPIETMRVAGLSSTIHDNIYNYPLPSDFKDIIDVYPQDNRNISDKGSRILAENFDQRKALDSKKFSIEGSEGSKRIRINWRSRAGKTLHTMDSVTENGTWSIVGTASGLKANSIFKVSGSASIEFDVAATGDGIQNSDMSTLDLTEEDEVSDIFVWMYFGSVSALTSVTAIWGNNLASAFWTSVAQTTQADGTAFKIGWNLLKFPWSTATETGTVDPATIDSFKITIARTAAISNIRVDNIIFSIGRNFDIKYYSKFLIKNSEGTWISRTTDDTDIVVLDNDCIQIYLLECLIAAAQQGTRPGSPADIKWAREELGDPKKGTGLYGDYVSRYRNQSKKERSTYYRL